MTQEEYDELLKRWGTMRGLNALVPVVLVIPQARPITTTEFLYYRSLTVTGMQRKHCHMHEWDDSYLSGFQSSLEPLAEANDDFDFFMAGRIYTYEEIRAIPVPEEVFEDEEDPYVE